MLGELANEMVGELANEMVRIQVERYGQGPAEAKAYFCDDFLVCAMKDCITTAERTMLERDGLRRDEPDIGEPRSAA